MTTSGAAVPGWYPDPYNPAQLRYWDGLAWGEQTAPGTARSDNRSPTGSGLGDVGDWLGDTFKVLIDRIVPVAILTVIVPAIGYTALLVVGASVFRGAVIDPVNDDVTGFEPGRLLLLIPIGAVLSVAAVLCYLAVYHQLYFAHRGEPRSLGASLAAAVRRLPRTIGWAIVLTVAAALVLGVLLVAPLVLALTVDASFAFLYLLVVPIFIVGAIWLGVSLSYLFVALAVSPSGTNPVSTSMGLVRGRWWGTFGRLLLLGVIVWLISVAFQVASSFAGTAALPFTSISSDPVTGEVTIDGEPVSDTEPFVVADVLPGTAVLVVFGLFSAVSQGVTQAISISGTTGLYRRAQGPADVGS